MRFGRVSFAASSTQFSSGVPKPYPLEVAPVASRPLKPDRKVDSVEKTEQRAATIQFMLAIRPRASAQRTRAFVTEALAGAASFRPLKIKAGFRAHLEGGGIGTCVRGQAPIRCEVLEAK